MKEVIQNTYLGLVYAFLYIPIAIVILFSFNNARFSLIWRGFTWDWYKTLLHDSDLMHVALHSLVLGVIASTLAVMLGALAAISLFRYRFAGRSAMQGLLFMMIIIPDVVTGIALLLLFRVMHFPFGFWSLLVAHITFCIQFVFITVNARLSVIDKHLIEASQDLGASEATLYRRILLPLLLPALLAGWLLSFTLSIDDVIISYFVSGPSFEILPLKIYSMVRLGVSPEINALSTILFGITLLIVACSQLLLRKKP